ncbi:putative Transport and Golgi organization 2 [Trypanosoma vivax]|uniref:NRDE family protein n=1 Tax=Trypanosoma vivax (strain Y486) TaxID=1055687 RepID=G0UDC0_TRYVY|nr:putative Transport and Golgi organization 2 [Trypanosoma vivax]CCC53831.1 hypothetical protein TVY486_1113150 [Trypanosoma vivax Y486]
MCIVAYITGLSGRFPLVLINNRDELYDRQTRPVAIDPSTGILCAADCLAGGTWLGINVANGRFALLTNCCRSPTAPLYRLKPAPQEAFYGQEVAPPTWWRGAMPLQEVRLRTRVHTSAAVDGGTNVWLEFVPDASRGCIVQNFLVDGTLPGHGIKLSAPSTWLTPSLMPPYYSGYNLLTANSLFDRQGPQLLYTTNRYGAEHALPTEHGVVHCLQNSYLDNWMEPKTSRLRALFQAALDGVLPKGTDAYDEEAVAEQFTSSCLRAQPSYDLLRDIESGSGPAQMLIEYQQVLDASLPYSGYNGETELARLYGEELQPPLHFPIDEHVRISNFRQRDIFVKGGAFGTRTHTVVVVERGPSDGKTVVHFSQCDVGTGDVQRVWKHFALRAASAGDG